VIKVSAVIVTVGTTVGVQQMATHRRDEVVASAPERVRMPAPAPAHDPIPDPVAVAIPAPLPVPVAVPVPAAVTVPVPAAVAVPARVPVPAAAAVPAAPHSRPIPRAVTTSSVTPPPAPAAPRPTLTDEVAILDTAVGALHRHDPRAALAALDTYDQRFANGALVPEATVARIEATLAIGDPARARELAAGFLAVHARSPLAARVRALVGSR